MYTWKESDQTIQFVWTTRTQATSLWGSVAEWLGIRRSRVQIPFWPLADVVLGSPEFNFSATLVNSQLVCLPPVGILNLVMFISLLVYIGPEKLQWGEANYIYIYISRTTKKKPCSGLFTALKFKSVKKKTQE